MSDPRPPDTTTAAPGAAAAHPAVLRLSGDIDFFTEDEFRAAADAVIVNDGDRDRTRERVRDAWAGLRGPTAGSSPGSGS
jgi:hypothetical protein